MENLNPVWFWAAVAAILLAGEVATGTFVLVFFAAAAVATALIALIAPLSFWGQLVCFGATGLISLLVGKRWVMARIRKLGAEGYSNDSGQEFLSSASLEPGAEGSLSYQGAPFTAINCGTHSIKVGDRVRVIGTQGIKIQVTKVMI